MPPFDCSSQKGLKRSGFKEEGWNNWKKVYETKKNVTIGIKFQNWQNKHC
jgi:hypothetical protein